jgi:hypothetical protein
MNPLDILFGASEAKKKPVCLVDTYSDVDSVIKNMDIGAQAILEEVKNFTSYINKKKETLRSALWNNVEMLLREKGVLPSEYHRDTHYFFVENGVIFYSEEENNNNSTNKGEEQYDN